jgi:hypothetical protein
LKTELYFAGEVLVSMNISALMFHGPDVGDTQQAFL